MIETQASTVEGASGPPPDAKLFVVGCARSGTTWVNSIVTEHPWVVGGPESHLLPALYEPLSADKPGAPRRDAVLAAYDRRMRGSFGDHGPHRWVTREGLERLLATAADRVPAGDETARYVVTEVLNRFFAENRGPSGRVLVEKTPRHLRHARRILEWWPNARIIEVVRDGRDVCVSLAHRSRVRAWAPSDRREQIDMWSQAIRTGQELRAHPLAGDRWHLVRYEDLSEDPVREIRRLYDFAQLPADDGLIGRVAEATSRENTSDMRKGLVGAHREEFSTDDARLFDRLAGDLLTAHGYDRSPVGH
jgi:hypothetical protein